MSTLKTYTIGYTIRDGEHQYGDSITESFDHEPTIKEQVGTIFDWWYSADDAERKTKEYRLERLEFIKAYDEEGYVEMPNDYRMIEDVSLDKEAMLKEEIKQALYAAWAQYANEFVRGEEISGADYLDSMGAWRIQYKELFDRLGFLPEAEEKEPCVSCGCFIHKASCPLQ